MTSVLTVTQYARHHVFRLLYQCILNQTVLPDEWVIVEGSRSESDARTNSELIGSLRDASDLRIVYVPYQPRSTLAQLRNRGYRACTSPLIVCMDDDDYYPPTRIQHVLEQFERYPSRQIAGCTNLLMYEYGSNTFYQFQGVHPNHSTQGAMAFTKAYALSHPHDEERTFAEESSFTKQFTEPMIQLSPIHTMIASSHSANTFDKRSLVRTNPMFRLLDLDQLPHYFPADTLQQYKDVFEMKKES